MAGFLLKGSYGGGSFDLSISLVAVFVVVSSSSLSSEGREKLTLVLTLVLGSEELNLKLSKVRKGDSDNGRSNLLGWFSVSEEEEEAKEMVLLEWLAAAMAMPMRRLLRTKGKGLDL